MLCGLLCSSCAPRWLIFKTRPFSPIRSSTHHLPSSFSALFTVSWYLYHIPPGLDLLRNKLLLVMHSYMLWWPVVQEEPGPPCVGPAGSREGLAWRRGGWEQGDSGLACLHCLSLSLIPPYLPACMARPFADQPEAIHWTLKKSTSGAGRANRGAALGCWALGKPQCVK